LNGKTISVTSGYQVSRSGTVYLANGTYEFTDESADNCPAYIHPVNEGTPTVTFENMNFVSTKTLEGSDYAKVMRAVGISLNETSDVEVKFVNCTFDQTTLIIDPQGTFEVPKYCNIKAVFENCTFNYSNDSATPDNVIQIGKFLNGNIDFTGCEFNVNSAVNTTVIAIAGGNDKLTVNVDETTKLNNLNPDVKLIFK
jgi:hypothetical protein